MIKTQLVIKQLCDMTELELQQYLQREYPRENARCEWKEYKIRITHLKYNKRKLWHSQ